MLDFAHFLGRREVGSYPTLLMESLLAIFRGVGAIQYQELIILPSKIIKVIFP